MARVNGIEKIKKAVLNNDKGHLSESQLAQLERIERAHQYMIDDEDRLVKSETVEALVQDFNISKTQAYADVDHAQVIFGALLYPRKYYAIGLHYESLQKELREAEDGKDWKRKQSAQKNITNFIDKFSDALDDEDYVSELDKGDVIIISNPTEANLPKISEKELMYKLERLGLLEDATIMAEVERVTQDG